MVYDCTALTPVDIAPAIVENSKEGVSTHVVNHAGESNADTQANEPKKGDWV